MVKPGGRLSFVLKAAARLFVGSLIARKNFERDFTVEHRVQGTKYRSHSAAAHVFQKLEVIQTLARQLPGQFGVAQRAVRSSAASGRTLGDDRGLIGIAGRVRGQEGPRAARAFT